MLLVRYDIRVCFDEMSKHMKELLEKGEGRANEDHWLATESVAWLFFTPRENE